MYGHSTRIRGNKSRAQDQIDELKVQLEVMKATPPPPPPVGLLKKLWRAING